MLAKKFKVTLSIPVEVWADTGIDAVMTEGKRCLEDSGYDDGRYPFSREIMAHGLTLMMKQAIKESVMKFFLMQHGKDAVVTEGNSTTNKAYHETEKWMASDLKGVIVEQDGWTAKIETIKQWRND
jgi:hypothetical protein